MLDVGNVLSYSRKKQGASDDRIGDGMATIVVNLVPPADPPSTPATVRVRIEDVSELDAAAEVVAEVVRPDVRLDAQQQVRVEVGALDPRARYVVRVHVDLDGSGVRAAGDLITTRAYPVSAGDAAPITVELSRIP
jgi:putative lipoprotein